LLRDTYHKKNDINLWKDTLKKFELIKSDNQVIIHSDNGIQYTSIFMQRYAIKNNIIISCSRAGNSLDNALCKTFFSSLKTEALKKQKLQTFDQTQQAINDYINYYNFNRYMIRYKDTSYDIWIKP